MSHALGRVHSYWSFADIKMYAEQQYRMLTATEFNDVLHLVEGTDADIGISWDIIDSCIEDVLVPK